MTTTEIKDFPIKTLCAEIAKVLTVKEIESQIRRFSKRTVEVTISGCALCLKFVGCGSDGQSQCSGCPYDKFYFDAKGSDVLGCKHFSSIRYDGICLTRFCDKFNPKAKRAALARYKMALKIKRGKP